MEEKNLKKMFKCNIEQITQYIFKILISVTREQQLLNYSLIYLFNFISSLEVKCQEKCHMMLQGKLIFLMISVPF